MHFNTKNILSYYQYIQKQENFPQAYSSELFLIGKTTQENQIKKEITPILKQIASPTIVKAFTNRIKIPVSGKNTDYSKTIEALLSLSNIAPDLDVASLLRLLKYSKLNLKTPSLLKKFNENLWFLEKLTNITHLYIDENTFTLPKIPEQIQHLKNLEYLEITGNYNYIPKCIGALKHLKVLKINMPYLKELPDTLKNHNSLKKLYLKGALSSFKSVCNTELQIPLWMGSLKKLKTLEISNLSISEIPEKAIPACLKKLRIYKLTELQKLPDSIGNVQSLATLEIYNCEQLDNLPQDLLNLKKLKNLRLGNLPNMQNISGDIVFSNTIKNINIPKNTTITPGACKDIARKKLRINNVSYLEYICKYPDAFSNLKELSIYDIKHFNYEKGIANLQGLKKLDMHRIANIPVLLQDIGSCKNLKHITLNNSSYTTLTGLETLTALKILKLHQCKDIVLDTNNLPRKFHTLDLGNIKTLTLGNKKLQLKQLKSYATDIEGFKNVGHSIHAKHIDLFYNESHTIDGKEVIEDLPRALENIKNLRSFCFTAKIKKISTDFSKFKKLQKLHIAGLKGLSYNQNYPIRHIKACSNTSVTDFSIQNYKGVENLAAIIQGFTNLTKLQIADIENIEVLALQQIKSLEVLSLNTCSFSTISLASNTLKTVKIISCNAIDIKKFIAENTWNSLNTLHLEALDIKEIPEDIDKMQYLQALILDQFTLEDLPLSITNLIHLKQLSIKYTRFNNVLSKSLQNLRIKELRMFLSKYTGNNMPRAQYDALITPNYTKIVKEFDCVI